MQTTGIDRRLDPPTLKVEHYPWAVTAVDDELVDISWQGVRLLSGVRALVRDRDWQTVPNSVESIGVVEDRGLTRLTIEIAGVGLGVDIAATLVATMDVDRFELAFTGRANAAFETNRTGLVVLHPLEAAGTSATVEHASGEASNSRFPDLISPHQPFMNMAAMRWEAGGVQARLECHGDVFETEDQRNWTDASFKTYSRPLELPFPYPIGAGEVIEQRLVLTAKAPQRWAPPPRAAGTDRIVIGDPTGAVVPAISSSARQVDSPRSFGSGLRLPSLLVEIDPISPQWRDALDLAIGDAGQLGAAVDLRLVLDDPNEGAEVLDRLGDVQLQRLGVFNRGSHVTEANLWAWVSEWAETLDSSPELIAGTRAHFTELNRNQSRITPVLARADGVTFSVTPQMHSTEIRHIVSSLRAQTEVLRSAQGFLDRAPIHVGPVTLEARFNAVATSDSGAALEMPPDPLTRTPFAAAWAVASVAAFSGGVASLSYYRVGELDGTEAGAVITELAGLAGLPVLSVTGPCDAGLGVFAVATSDGPRVLVGNLTRCVRQLIVQGPAGDVHELVVAPWAFGTLDFAHAG